MFRRIALITGWVFLLTACGGGGSGGSDSLPGIASTPGAPTGVVVNAGDGALSLGWSAPAFNGGSAISGYQVSITPQPPGLDIQVSGTRALLTGLSNGVSYQLTVAAMNVRGVGRASTAVNGQPEAAITGAYTQLTIPNNPAAGSATGIYDPSLLRASNDDLWLAYSAVNFTNSGGIITQDVGLRIARSSDNGISFLYERTVKDPENATVTDPFLVACGMSTCNGRWVFETSTLIEDPSDPNPNRRFKLFAHQYFLYPGNPKSNTVYHLGALVMFTASTPDSLWSGPRVVLDWPLSPPELAPGQDITGIDPALANCLILGEPGAAVVDGRILLAAICPYNDAMLGDVQKIVLLQSSDHAASFSYLSTLLTPADAPSGVRYFSAPALIATDDNAPVLLVTDVVDIGGNDTYKGSRVFPLAAEGSHAVFRVLSVAQSILASPTSTTNTIGGASAYARDTGSLGILQSDAIPPPPMMSLDASQFHILATHAMVEQ